MPLRSRFLVVVALLALASLASLTGRALAADPSAEFREAVAAIEDGAFGDAVDRLELLADQGFVHPDASYNRAIAYLGRARSPQKQPGDLGRAAQALAETARLRPGDPDAEALLEAVRTEIGRRRARSGGSGLVARPRLGRAIAGLVPEPVWGGAAALGSLALAAGIGLRLRKSDALAVPSALAMGLGALLFVLGATGGLFARHFRRTSAPAVVVVEEARLLDASGRPLPQTSSEGNVVPEGADVLVLERRAGLARIEWGSAEGWVVAGQVRELAGE